MVEILNLGAREGDEWGYTGIFDRDNGGSFLTDHFPDACKAIWNFEGIWCHSRHIPGVMHPPHNHSTHIALHEAVGGWLCSSMLRLFH